MNKFEPAEVALSQLVGLSFLYAGAAGPLLWVHFGPEITITKLGGGTRTVGTWALHIDCPWRISGINGVVTGSGDYWEPPELGIDWRDDNFDANKDQRRFDIQIRNFNSQFRDVPVKKVTVDLCGGFKISIGRSHFLEAFPVKSQDIEYWRLFQPGEDSAHFVVTGTGIED